MNPKDDPNNFWNQMLRSLRIPIIPRRRKSKHAAGRDSAIYKYRAIRRQKKCAARATRKVQRRLDRQSSKRQRSGRRR